jgi:nitrate/nitrite transporter NarK
LGGVDDDEIGSASGVLQSVQQLGTSLGIAGVGTLLFSLIGAQAASKVGFLHAAHQTMLAVLALIAVATVLAALLPRRARTESAEWSAAELDVPLPDAALV